MLGSHTKATQNNLTPDALDRSILPTLLPRLSTSADEQRMDQTATKVPGPVNDGARYGFIPN